MTPAPQEASRLEKYVHPASQEASRLEKYAHPASQEASRLKKYARHARAHTCIRTMPTPTFHAPNPAKKLPNPASPEASRLEKYAHPACQEASRLEEYAHPERQKLHPCGKSCSTHCKSAKKNDGAVPLPRCLSPSCASAPLCLRLRPLHWPRRESRSVYNSLEGP